MYDVVYYALVLCIVRVYSRTHSTYSCMHTTYYAYYYIDTVGAPAQGQEKARAAKALATGAAPSARLKIQTKLKIM